MHANFFLLALTAIGAMAAPAQKRALVTEVDVVTKVVYVTATAGAPMTTHEKEHPVVIVTKTVGEGQYGPPHGHHHFHHKPASTEEAPPPAYTTVQPEPEPTSTPEPEPTSTTKAKPSHTKTKTKTHTHTHTAEPEPTNNPVLSKYASTVVRHHNVHRANHSASDIQWSHALANTARKIADTCYYAHNTDMDGGGYGQNIAAGTTAKDISTVITDEFYNGEVWKFSYYGEPNPPNFEEWGHFSQVVWKDTTHVGCYTKYCSGGLSADTPLTDVPPYFTVCNYKAVGNMAGEYGDQIGASLGHPSVFANY